MRSRYSHDWRIHTVAWHCSNRSVSASPYTPSVCSALGSAGPSVCWGPRSAGALTLGPSGVCWLGPRESVLGPWSKSSGIGLWVESLSKSKLPNLKHEGLRGSYTLLFSPSSCSSQCFLVSVAHGTGGRFYGYPNTAQGDDHITMATEIAAAKQSLKQTNNYL